MKAAHKKVSYGILVVFAGIVGLALYKFPWMRTAFTNTRLQYFISSAGILAPAVFILLQFFVLLSAVLPGHAVTVIGGFLFGAWLGALYSYIGMVTASMFVFFVSRRFGKNFVESLVDKSELRHLHLFYKKHGAFTFFLLRLIPLIPVDIISLGAGLTSVKAKDYFMVSAVSFVAPVLFYSFVGHRFSEQLGGPVMYAFGIVALISIIIFLCRHPIKKWMLKEIRQLEQES